MITVIIRSKPVECDDCMQVLTTMKNSNRFTCEDTLDEYISGLKKRIKAIYGVDMRRSGGWALLRYLKQVGEIKVEGI